MCLRTNGLDMTRRLKLDQLGLSDYIGEIKINPRLIVYRQIQNSYAHRVFVCRRLNDAGKRSDVSGVQSMLWWRQHCVCGPTVQWWNNLKLKQLVNNETIHSYRASLIATLSPSCQSFVLVHGTCLVTEAFESTSDEVMKVFTGLTALHCQVCSHTYLDEYFRVCGEW